MRKIFKAQCALRWRCRPISRFISKTIQDIQWNTTGSRMSGGMDGAISNE